VDVLPRRLVLYAALAAGLFGAILALIGCAVAAVAGSAPSPGVLAAIVVGVGLAFALLARFLIRRIPWFGVALFVARRAASRSGRRGSKPP
jgi:membrane-bound ClpP family serine protease